MGRYASHSSEVIWALVPHVEHPARGIVHRKKGLKVASKVFAFVSIASIDLIEKRVRIVV